MAGGMGGISICQLNLSSIFLWKGGCRGDGRERGDGQRGWQFYKGDDF